MPLGGFVELPAQILASPGNELLKNFWKSELGWLLRQIRSRVFTLLLVSLLLFVLFRFLPGSAQQVSAVGQPGTIADSIASQHAGGLVSGLFDYLSWLGGAVILDFGTSYRYGLPVTRLVAEHLSVSAVLGISALVLFYVFAIPLGLLAAFAHAHWTGKVLSHAFSLLYSLPAFWISLLLLMLFSGGDYLAIFPVTGLSSLDGVQRGLAAAFFDRLWHLILPVACLSYSGIGYVARQVESATLECLGADFLLAAKAKGMRRVTIMRRHILPHALLPVVALTSQFFPALFAGSVVVETIFSLPGMGRLTLDSVLARDCPVLMAIGFLSALVSLAGSFFVDWLLRNLHPGMEGD